MQITSYASATFISQASHKDSIQRKRMTFGHFVGVFATLKYSG